MLDEKKLLEAIYASRRPIGVADLARALRLRGDQRRELHQFLRRAVASGMIAQVRGKSYTKAGGRSAQIIGRLEVTSKGFGFVRPDWGETTGKPGFEGDLFIGERDMADALDGDIVRAEVMRRGKEGAGGKITEVVERAHTHIVGWFQATPKGGQVFPRNKRINRRIFVPRPPKDLGVADFDWVEVEITKFGTPEEPLFGNVASRLGSDVDRGIDVLLVLRDRGIIEEFPHAAEAEAKRMDFDWKRDLAGREDYRSLPTITIDPLTAKDYDDGLSAESLGDRGWRLYVHIADVSHFVRPGTAIDSEAQDRSTSVYPVDRVVPMLPHKLSSNLCSLVPDQDRLTLTAVMEIDRDGALRHTEVHSGVIRSARRFTYEEAQAYFDGSKSDGLRAAGDGKPSDSPSPLPSPVAQYPAPVTKLLDELRQIAATLRRARFKRGALDLDIPEVQIIFDESGAASDIKFREHLEAHQLVEECMLIANEAVAQLLTRRQAPLLYRVHESAEPERLERLAPVLKAFGVRLPASPRPADIQAALETARKHPAGHIVRRLILRALKRAQYDPVNVGHFGLASECYCHFTSPIRRYPDVVVHRQLKALEAGGKLAYDAEDNELDALGEHTSARERRAQEAEWEAIAIKSLEFMKRHEGGEFDAFISGVHSFGLFLELQPYPVEGFVKRAALKGDTYDIDEHGIQLTGRSSGHRLKLGDKVRVQIERVDPMAQQLDVTILDLPVAGGRRKGGGFDKFRGGGPSRPKRRG